MSKQNILNDLAKKLSDALPPSLKALQKDCEQNFHAVLKTTFSKLDLISCEEFDAQTKVLARSRKRIEALEIKIKELEKIMKNR